MNENMEIIDQAIFILMESDIYVKLNRAYKHWQRLKKYKYLVCELCGKECLTGYHHIDKTLRPKVLFYGFNHTNFWVDEKVVPLGPKALFDSFIDHCGIDNLNKSIEYFSVERNELMELCPPCHLKIHFYKGA